MIKKPSSKLLYYQTNMHEIGFWSNDHFQGECYLFLGISKKIMLFRTLFLNILSYITFTIPNISDIAVPYLDVYLCSGFYMMLLTNINT